AVVAWRVGDHARAVELLAPARARLWRIGGSHAQRDLFTLILIDAAMRSGQQALAREVRAERAAQRPNGRLPRRLAGRGPN
ncbi:MAG: tetratricopeptide repeat protein, partial [Burkholderiales bacterium]